MKKLILMIVFCLLPVMSAFAVKVSSLYQAEVSVPTQMDDDRKQAMQRGFLQVLVRVSGNPQIEKNPMIKDSIHRADYYVQDFSYSSASTSASEYLLQIHFDKKDVNRLLRRAGVAYWGENRPLILVWLTATNNQHINEIIGIENPQTTREKIRFTINFSYHGHVRHQSSFS